MDTLIRDVILRLRHMMNEIDWARSVTELDALEKQIQVESEIATAASAVIDMVRKVL